MGNSNKVVLITNDVMQPLSINISSDLFFISALVKYQ